MQNASETTQDKTQGYVSSATIADVYDVELRKSSVWFTTRTNGCTSADSFEVLAQNTSSGETSLTIYRRKPDLCKGMTRLINIELPLVLPSNAKDIVISNAVLPKTEKVKASKR